MKRLFLPSFVIAALFSLNASAQSSKAFAFTAETKGAYTWNVLREIDLSTGEVVRTIYNPSENKPVKFEATANSRVAGNLNQLPSPTTAGVAAAAYDGKHNRLYFSQMWNNELRYFDLNSNQEVKVVINTDAAYSTGNRNGESNIVTRMTFASDGNGYALTNDGNQLIRFTTDEKPVVTNLGSLIDSKKNNGISVHSQCTSWGGDMIGDAYGNLYLITYKSHVFKINVNTLVAEHIGTIKGLPETFTTNGAAIDGNGDLVVTSSIATENYYKVNLSTLEAKAVAKTGTSVYNASDLANANLAYAAARTTAETKAEVKGNAVLSVYPNPAVNKNFSIQFEKVPAGNYTIELSDLSGRKVLNKAITVSGLQNEKVTMPKGSAAGLYFVKVMDNTGKAIYSDKVAVQ